jgi:hypothetical protein
MQYLIAAVKAKRACNSKWRETTGGTTLSGEGKPGSTVRRNEQDA